MIGLGSLPHDLEGSAVRLETRATFKVTTMVVAMELSTVIGPQKLEGICFNIKRFHSGKRPQTK
eukprot:5901288-Amphidinium_carterae.1